MALAFITLEEAKQYSRIQHTALDATIIDLIEAASMAVKGYLKSTSPWAMELDDDGNEVEDSSGDTVPLQDSNGYIVRPQVKMATRMLVDRWLKHTHQANPAAHGYLPAEVVAILYPLRDPALR